GGGRSFTRSPAVSMPSASSQPLRVGVTGSWGLWPAKSTPSCSWGADSSARRRTLFPPSSGTSTTGRASSQPPRCPAPPAAGGRRLRQRLRGIRAQEHPQATASLPDPAAVRQATTREHLPPEPELRRQEVVPVVTQLPRDVEEPLVEAKHEVARSGLTQSRAS